jgi:HK97 family phage portal protein
MNILRKIKRAFQEKSFMYPTIGELVGNENRLPQAKAHSYEPYMRTYENVAWVYACVSLISDNMASLPFEVTSKDGKQIKGPLQDLLNNPNPTMSGADLIKFISQSLELTGNAYLLKDMLVGKRPTRLFPLQPELVRIESSGNADAPVLAYRYQAGGKSVYYTPQDVIHIRYISSGDFFYGLGPISAARACIDTYRAAEKNNLKIFDNGAIPDGILSTESALDDEQRKRIAAAWNAKYRGEHNAHKTAILEAGLKYQAIGINQRDLEFIAGQKMTREAICSVFRVPPAMVGIYEYAPQHNTEEQQKILYNFKILPSAGIVADTLARALFPLFSIPDGAYIWPNSSSIASILSSVKDKVSAASEYQRMGFTRNEVIKALDLPFPETPDGDMRYQPQYVIASQPIDMGLSAPQSGVKSASISAPKGYEFKKISRRELKAHQKERLKLAQSFEDNFIKPVGKTFQEKKAALLKFFDDNGKAPAKYSDVFEYKAEIEKLTAAKEKPTDDMYEAGKDDEQKFLSSQIEKRLAIIPQGKAVRKDWFEKRAARWSRDSEDFTRNAINEMFADVEEMREQGASVEELRRQISNTMDDMAVYRARRIAQTETIAALNQSAVDAYKETPEVSGKGWLATLDSATRDTHIEAGRRYGDGNEIPVDEDFIVGNGKGPAPGQIDEAAESVNCRCTVYPAILTRRQ